MKPVIQVWDWKEPPELAPIIQAVNAIPGKTHMRELNTGQDNFVLIIADHEIGDDEAWALYSS